MIEAKEIVVDTCKKVVKHYIEKYNALPKQLKIRIDLENTNSKPVFGIFNNSTLFERTTLKQIVRAGGGKTFSMIIGVSVRNIIKDIFVQSLKQLDMKDSKQICLILYLKEDKEKVTDPHIALYKNGDYLWSLPISEVMDATLAEQKK